ncbi:hypothetical protein ACF08M_27165 [Streptomyces sp. NPDC015032]|uniref:hypothetical protein n=1 Tax=Streptomyces sp. NPDC015032 TaxID=3364937 RepID=UPI0036F76246
MTTLQFAGAEPEGRLPVQESSGAQTQPCQHTMARHQMLTARPGEMHVEANRTIVSPKLGRLAAALVRRTTSSWARFGVEEQ